MADHTAAWNEASPAGSDLASQIDNFMRDMKRDVRERLALEHNWNSATATGSTQDGHHKEISITPATTNTPLIKTNSNQSLTGSDASSCVDLGVTWNTTGAPTALKINVTNTASDAAAKLLDLQVGGSSKFQVRKDGGTAVVAATPYATPGLSLTVTLDDSTGASTGLNVAVSGSAGAFVSNIIKVERGTERYFDLWANGEWAFGRGTGSAYSGELLFYRTGGGHSSNTQMRIAESVTAPASSGAGPGIVVGRRSVGGNGAAGYLALTRRDGTAYYIWIDQLGKLRMHTSAPIDDGSDTAGTIVGTQS